MEVDDVLKRVLLDGVIFSQQIPQLAVNVGRCCCFHTTHLIGQSLIIPHGEPSLTGIGRTGLEYQMQLLNQRFGQLCPCLLNDQVDTPEVVSRLNDIVHPDRFVSNTDGVRLENVPRLVVSQAATLNVVGVIGEINLDTVIDTSLNPSVLLFLE